MTPEERKAAFRLLLWGHDLDHLAMLLGVSIDTLRGWHKPSNPRAPSEEQLRRLRQAAIADLAARIRSLGLDDIPCRNSAVERKVNISNIAA